MVVSAGSETESAHYSYLIGRPWGSDFTCYLAAGRVKEFMQVDKKGFLELESFRTYFKFQFCGFSTMIGDFQ